MESSSSNNNFNYHNSNQNNIQNSSNNDGEKIKEFYLNNKLTLRKKKINKIFQAKREPVIAQIVNSELQNTIPEKLKINRNDLCSGKIYEDLENAIIWKQEENQIEIIKQLTAFFKEESIQTMSMIDALIKSGPSVKNPNEKYFYFPIGNLFVKIIKNTNCDILFLLCVNLLLNFSYVSDDFCESMSNPEIIDFILHKLVELYPCIIDNKLSNEVNNSNNINNEEKISQQINKNNKISIMEADKAKTKIIQGFYVASQVIKLIGNLFISCYSKINFNRSNFFQKIFYMLTMFDMEKKDIKFRQIFFEYLDCLIWIITFFFNKIPEIHINYQNEILNIIPNLIKNIRSFYYVQDSNRYLEKLIEVLEYLSNTNAIYSKKMIENDALKIISNLFGYLFISGNNGEIVLTTEIQEKILGIYINIFTLENEYINSLNIDMVTFQLVIEKLFIVFKLHYQNHRNIQSNLITLLSNLACFNDNQYITSNFIMNRNIIEIVFKYYYKHNQDEVLLLIDNVMEKHEKKEYDFVLGNGGWKIIQDNICNYETINNNEFLNKSIVILGKIIKKEKNHNIRFLFDELAKTNIFEVIKIIFSNNSNLEEETKKILESILEDYDMYERSLR